METILITGGAGFIGSKLVDKLITEYNIIVLDNFLKQVHGDDKKLKQGIKYIIGDIADPITWSQLDFNKIDYIIHLASETGTGQSMDNISNYVSTNILGTSHMLEKLNQPNNSVKKVILSSSRAIYKDHVISDAEEPTSIYGLTKLTQEKLLKISCPVPYTILRYQNVYGPGQSLKNPYTGVISIFSEKLYSGEDIEIWDNGLPTRDFIYVDDVVKATILPISNQKSNNKIYDIGNGKSTSLLKVGEMLKEFINPSCKVNTTNYHKEGYVIVPFIRDVFKAKKDFNWKPLFSFEQGLAKFIEWFKKEKEC